MKFKEFKKLYSDISLMVNHDFAKVRDYLVKCSDEVSEKEDGPFVGQVVLEYKGPDLTSLCVAIWTHNPDGSYTKYEQQHDFYSFKNIPSFVTNELLLSHRYEIVFRPTELNTIRSERNMNILTDIKDLPKYVKRIAKNVGCENENIVVEIADAGLYYRVKVYTTGNPSPIASFLTVSTDGIDNEIQKKLNSTHYVQLIF